MGLDKLEKKFKDQLNQREITPTPAAWDRLDAMLTVGEEKEVKPIYNWIYIAASIIGFFAIGYVFFSNPEALVDVKRHDVVIENSIPIKTTDSTMKEQQTVIPIQEKKEIIADRQSATQKNSNSTSNSQPLKHSTRKLFDLDNNKSIADKTNQETTSQSANIDQKTNEVIQSQQSQIAQNNPITQVQTDMKMPTVKVNASNLLSEVDNELELSFREKVIMKINKNYKTVKSSVANRNQTHDQ